MKTSFPLLCCLTILFTAVANAQKIPEPAEWKRYTVNGQEFSVTLPTRPSVSTTNDWIVSAQKSRVRRTILAMAGGVLYTIYAYQNPKPRQSLADFVSDQTAKHRKELVANRSVQISGVAGQEFTSLGPNNQHTAEQFFATEQHLYKFAVYGADAEDERTRQFFSSITFGHKPNAIALDEDPGLPLLSSEDDSVAMNEVDQRPHFIERVPPDYTEEARRNKVSGAVILKVLLSSAGTATNIRVVSGLPFGLTERAIVAARQLRFTPAMKDGKPVSVWMEVEFNFNIY